MKLSLRRKSPPCDHAKKYEDLVVRISELSRWDDEELYHYEVVCDTCGKAIKRAEVKESRSAR